MSDQKLSFFKFVGQTEQICIFRESEKVSVQKRYSSFAFIARFFVAKSSKHVRLNDSFPKEDAGL